MKIVLSLLAVGMPVLVEAQAFQPAMTYPPPANPSRGVEYNFSALGRYNSNDTPTMREQKLKRAIALRERVSQLLVEDGGTLTSRHRYHVRREAYNILHGNDGYGF